MRKFQVLLLVLCNLAFALSAHALEIRELVIKFNEGYLTERPINIGSQMAVWQVDKYIAIPSIPNVMSFKPIGYPVNHPIGFSGPFVVEVLLDEDPVEYLAQVLSDPNIEYAIWGDESATPLSEDPAKLFPPQNQDLFCNERQLHRRIEGEPLGNGEWCSEVEEDEDHDMDLPQAWGISKGDTSIVVAIIDSGVDWRHPDFGGSPPPFQVAPEESVFFYRDGNIFTNWNEELGDANGDGRPGIAGVDDNGNGFVDEDSQGFEEWNDSESDVIIGAVTSVSGNFITDNSQVFLPSIQGFRFYANPNDNSTFGHVLSVNGNELEVALPDGVPPIYTWEEIFQYWGPLPWPFKIGDGQDNNEAFPDGFIDDIGWLNDFVNDDDENGFPDDIHGWDFISNISGSHTPIAAEDYLVPDNNPYSLAQHGTTMASLLGATDLKGRVVGVSPKVKILPLRIGYAKWDAPGSIGVGGLQYTERVMAYDYAKKMGVDIVSLSMDKKDRPGNQCPIWTSGDSATQDLIDYGAVVIVAAGNDGFIDPDTPNLLGCPSPSLVVAGVDILDIYDTPDPSYISDYGDWVDLSACFGPVWAATPLGMGISVEPDYTNWVVGTSGCAPMVAGVAVLVRSIYPHFSVEEVVNKIKFSTDDIYQYPENFNYIGKLGTGRVNAYKALTFYGQIPASAPDTTWAHDIWIGGDVAIPAGSTVTIESGVTVHVARDDLLSTGTDPTKIEWVVNGQIVMQGSAEAPVVFELIDDPIQTWECHDPCTLSGGTYFVDELSATCDYVYLDKSAETLMQYSGQPRNARSMNYNNNEFKDLFLTRFDESAMGWDGNGITLGGAPQFVNTTFDAFPLNSAPTAGTTGIVPADFDNDGHVDFFAPHLGGNGRLYRNVDGSAFADWTAECGLENPEWSYYVSHAFTCSWADYDADGNLDLTVLYTDGVSDPGEGGNYLAVLHNNGGVFDAIALTAEEAVGVSPLWADFDNDGDLDLLILRAFATPPGIPNPSYNRLYENREDGTFYTVYDPISSFPNYGATIAAVVDFDNDSDLDVVGAEGGGVFFLENNEGWPSIHFSLGSSILSSFFEGEPTDLAVLDYDLDGYQDFLVGFGDPNLSTGSTVPRLIANAADGFGERVLVDIESELGPTGLTGTDKFVGIAAADYDGDGGTDIYLTRAETSPFFYKANVAVIPNPKNWIGIRLKSLYGANNTQGIGATVQVTAGSVTQAQVVDGGSGYASQHDADLVFGLGENLGPVSVIVKWPTGHVQVLPEIAANQYHVILDDSPVLDSTSIQFSRVYHVNTGLEDWVFTWETYNNCPTSLDKITLSLAGVPERCWPEAGVLTEQTYGVTVAIEPLGEPKYRHVLTCANIECEPTCTIPYSIESAVVDYTSTSEGQTLRIKSCLLAQ